MTDLTDLTELKCQCVIPTSMPKRVSPEVENCTIRSYFEGHSRDETVEICGSSAGKVSTDWRELERKIGQAGVDLRDLAVKMRKMNLTIGEASRGANVYGLLQQIRVEEEGLETFLKNFYNASVRKGKTPETLVDAASRLLDVEEESGLPSEQILKRASEKAEELKKTKEELELTKRSLQQLKVEVRSALREQETSKEALESYVKVRDGMKRYGIDVDQDLEKAANLLSNAKEHDYDVETLITEAKLHISLMTENATLTKMVKSLRNEDQELKGTIAENKDALNELDSVKKLGFTEERLQVLKEKVVKIGSARGMKSGEVLEKFFEDLKEYDAKVGYEHELKILTSKIETARLDIARLEAEKDKLERSIKERRDAVDAVQTLTKSGVEPRHIVEWEKVLKKAEVSVTQLHLDLEQYGRLMQVIDQKREEISKLEEHHRKLGVQIEELDGKKTDVEQSIVAIRDAAISNIQEVSTDSHKAVDAQNRDIENLKEKTLKLAEEVLKKLGSISEEGVARIEDTDNETKRTIEELRTLSKTLVEESVKHGEEMGKLQALKPLFEVLEGKSVEPRKLHLTFLVLLQRYGDWMGEMERLTLLKDKLAGTIKAIQFEVSKGGP